MRLRLGFPRHGLFQAAVGASWLVFENFWFCPGFNIITKIQHSYVHMFVARILNMLLNYKIAKEINHEKLHNYRCCCHTTFSQQP